MATTQHATTTVLVDSFFLRNKGTGFQFQFSLNHNELWCRGCGTLFLCSVGEEKRLEQDFGGVRATGLESAPIAFLFLSKGLELKITSLNRASFTIEDRGLKLWRRREGEVKEVEKEKVKMEKQGF